MCYHIWYVAYWACVVSYILLPFTFLFPSRIVVRVGCPLLDDSRSVRAVLLGCGMCALPHASTLAPGSSVSGTSSLFESLWVTIQNMRVLPSCPLALAKTSRRFSLGGIPLEWGGGGARKAHNHTHVCLPLSLLLAPPSGGGRHLGVMGACSAKRPAQLRRPW